MRLALAPFKPPVKKLGTPGSEDLPIAFASNAESDLPPSLPNGLTDWDGPRSSQRERSTTRGNL